MMRYLILIILIVFVFSCAAMSSKDKMLLLEKKLFFQLKTVTDKEDTDAPFLYLNSNGSLYGSTGCNRFFGSYDIDYDNSSIVFSQIASTKVLCSSELNQQEKYILNSLSSSKKYTIEKNNITFLNANNSVVIKLTFQ